MRSNAMSNVLLGWFAQAVRTTILRVSVTTQTGGLSSPLITLITLSTLAACDVRAETGVACEAGRAAGPARGSAAVSAVLHSRPRPAGAAVAQPHLAFSLDREGSARRSCNRSSSMHL